MSSILSSQYQGKSSCNFQTYNEKRVSSLLYHILSVFKFLTILFFDPKNILNLNYINLSVF
jgi:hypothetical protein